MAKQIGALGLSTFIAEHRYDRYSTLMLVYRIYQHQFWSLVFAVSLSVPGGCGRGRWRWWCVGAIAWQGEGTKMFLEL